MTKIVRVSDDKYELRVDEDVIETYQQSKMRHPDDWATDAVDAGVDGWSISSGDWEFIDER